ncbi:testis-specific Y-encoded-like protein 2 isoform X3 [Homo sapiens]|uniref:testis-specific Y-encoded-like protein 2 isoform X3 n=1 Tax=Homo sapiens TaxID=9606 RepID=UPI0003EB039C|nr:testis-specific Y-encoded-like protein 2 isoform X3 [Homo sapiens]XP_054183543.1 testis-specific Y-encoded-like protein 2 isoform X3 [Homo sapiens]|eukprot:XP_006724655.1 testis-specific Y-encoded-like protein 2 isoform X3 [Homo sapiens]
MDRPDEGPPAKTRRLSSSESPQRDPPPPPPPPPLLRLPLPPPQQRPRLQEETEAAQVLADMRGVGLGPALPPPPPYVILEEGGIRAYFTLGAECPGWDSTIESGYGEAPPPTESLEALPTPEASGGSLEIDFQVVQSSSFGGEGALETCSAVGWAPQRLVDPKSKEEAIIIVEDEDEDERESMRSSRRRRRRRRRKQRKVKRESRERNAERMESILQALEDIQLDLEAVNIKAGKAFLRLKRKFIQMRRPFLERRDLIIQHIPGFWVKAFLNHPRISILINRRDEDIFRYLTNLQVQDLRHISMGYKMKLYFQTNPYFTNMVIVKEFQRNRSGRLVSHSTPIRWHRGQEPQARRHGNQDASHSFFSWFSNHSLPEADRIAEIIKNDLWVNPLRYYLRERGSRIKRKKQEMKKRKTRGRCEVVIMEDAPDYYAVEDIFSEISDIDETIHDIKISDFMETTDYFETTDNEITDINENICDSENPDHNEVPNNETTDNNESADDHETTDNNESADDNNENPEDNNKNTDDNEENPNNNENTYGNNFFKGGFWGSHGNNQDSSDSDNEADEASDDEDNDGNEGDNEGSDDDGNEGDNEGSDDDDRDIEYYEKVIEDFDKDQADYEDVIEIISDESVEEEGIEEGELIPPHPCLPSFLFSEQAWPRTGYQGMNTICFYGGKKKHSEQLFKQRKSSEHLT